jgi:site-specific recombinase XerD
MDAVSVGDMFSQYQKKAGIVRQPFDGKGFHGLRRRLAKKLIVNGTSLTTVAQILGHNDLQSVRQYLSLDTNNLRECALDFSGIPLEGGLEK